MLCYSHLQRQILPQIEKGETDGVTYSNPAKVLKISNKGANLGASKQVTVARSGESKSSDLCPRSNECAWILKIIHVSLKW